MKRFAGLLAALLTFIVAPGLLAQAAPRPPGAATRPAVLVLPIAGDVGDSIRTIVRRDLDYGDALAPDTLHASAIRSLAPVADAPLDVEALAAFGARYVIAAHRRGDSLEVAAFDMRSANLVSSRAFAVPEVPPRLREDVRDSLIRFYALADSVARARIRVVALTRDSLLRAAPARPPRTEAEAENAEWRALLLTALAREDSTMRAWIRKAPAERDSLIVMAARRDAVLHDSLSYIQRMRVHVMADEVQLWLTGSRGVAASRVAYVSAGRLHVVDSDGANQRVLTTVGRALSPTWHPSGRWIVFSELGDAGTQIAEVDVETGELQYLSATPRGYNLTPVYTPDGERIVFAAVTADGNRLVSVARGSATARPLAPATRDASSPTFSPDGRRMAFVVPRPYAGTGETARTRPAMIVANANGSGATPLVPRGSDPATARTSPEWSPDGQHIAFSQQLRLWVMRVRDRVARRVGEFSGSEDPTWAPDSRHIAFSLTQGPMREVWILDINTGRTRRLTYTQDARLPAWSPRWSD